MIILSPFADTLFYGHLSQNVILICMSKRLGARGVCVRARMRFRTN